MYGWSADNWYRIDFFIYGRQKKATGTEYTDCQQVLAQKKEAESGYYNIRGNTEYCEMDTEDGGWTRWTSYGPSYTSNVAEVMFEIPDWKLDLGFDEWYIVADKNIMW